MSARASHRRLTSSGLPVAIVGMLVVAGLAGCGRGIEAGGIGSVPNAETPRPSAGSSAQAAVTALRTALEIGGYDLEPATRTYQPAQPAALISVPRSAYQVRLSDPDGGIVLIYEFPTAESATTGAEALADYLSSAPGKINFPGDASFHVAHLGPAVIMSWFSPSQSADPEAGQGAFDLVSTVGAAVSVLR